MKLLVKIIEDIEKLPWRQGDPDWLNRGDSSKSTAAPISKRKAVVIGPKPKTTPPNQGGKSVTQQKFIKKHQKHPYRYPEDWLELKQNRRHARDAFRWLNRYPTASYDQFFDFMNQHWQDYASVPAYVKTLYSAWHGLPPAHKNEPDADDLKK